MMFNIRNKISDFEEEVYGFQVTNSSIKYICFWKSKRRNLDEPFGYDWNDYCSNKVAEKYPLKVSNDVIVNTLIEKIKKLEIE